MPEVANLYDNGPISPVCKIFENIGILSGGNWEYHTVQFIEPLPRSGPLVADLVAISGNTTIPGTVGGIVGTINQQLVQFLRMNEGELLHLRFEPIDDVDVLIAETGSIGRFTTNFVRARVTRFTAFRDPNLATTTFFVVGQDNDPYIEVRNPTPVAQPMARVAFWGFRYVINEVLTAKPTGPITYIPAEGRGVGGR
jgi:hypothetical protein